MLRVCADGPSRQDPVNQHNVRHANDYFSFTSQMNDRFTQGQKIQVVEFMWQVAYAAGALHAKEAAQQGRFTNG